MDTRVPQEYWASVLAKRNDFTDSDESKIKYLKELTSLPEGEVKFQDLILIVRCLENKLAALDLVKELTASNPGPAGWLFSMIVQETSSYQGIAEFIDGIPGDKFRERFLRTFFKESFGKASLADISHILDVVSRDEKERSKIQEIMTREMNLRLQQNPGVVGAAADPGLIREIAKTLPSNLGNEVLVNLEVRQMQGLDVDFISRKSDELGVEKVEFVRIVLGNSDLRGLLNPAVSEQILQMVDASKLDSFILNFVVIELGRSVKPDDLANTIQRLPEESRNAVVPLIAGQCALGSSKQAAYELISQMPPNDRDQLVAGVESIWPALNSEGPGLEEFRKLRSASSMRTNDSPPQ